MGCAIWAYKGWIGKLFPAGSPSSKFLQLYSQRFSTVECNSTFYSIPSTDAISRWVQETPSTFQFCPKLPRSITHDGDLQPKIGTALSFIELMQGLGPERLGSIFIQLPPRYGPQAFEDLQKFLQGLGEGIRGGSVDLSLEVRHPQWFQPAHAQQLNGLLTELEMGRVLLDSRPIYECSDDPQLTSERRKPRLPLQPTMTASFGLVRYISHPDTDFNRRFMMTWIPYMNDWLRQGKRIYLFVHCPIEEHSPQNAQLFQELLEKHLDVSIPPLPWSTIQPDPTQLSLF
jgi:uncharacterized protein YecE (DUF72 family)